MTSAGFELWSSEYSEDTLTTAIDTINWNILLLTVPTYEKDNIKVNSPLKKVLSSKGFKLESSKTIN